MSRRFVIRVVTLASALFISLGPVVQAQNRALPGQGGLPAPVDPLTLDPLIGPGTLGTGYVFSSAWCGPFIDMTAAAGSAVAITGFQMYFKGTVNRNVSVYWKAGTYVGSEATAGPWTLLGTVNVTPGGDGTLTSVAIGGVTIPASQTYGFKVWDGVGGQSSNGPGLDIRSGGTAASDANLSLASNAYTCNNIFEAAPLGYGWQGNVLYTDGVPVPTMGDWTIALLFVMLSGLAFVVLRRRNGLAVS